MGTEASTATTGPSPLLERDREVGVIAARAAAAAAGEAAIVCIEGAAGIGKSRLMAEARRLAAGAGLRVLSARGGELEREFPFGIVRQLFEPVLADADLAGLALAGSAAAARGVFEAVSEERADDDISFSALHGLYWLTANLAGAGPLALVVDDLHWCDRPSLRYLSYCTKRLDGSPVLIVLSLRPSEPGADAALLAELSGDASATSLQPRSLTLPAAAALLRRRLGEDADPAFVEACHASTGGNPLLLTELLKALEAEAVAPEAGNVRLVEDIGPRSASRAVLVRLARLPPAVVAVARALAVLGEGADLAMLASLAEVTVEGAAEATASLARAEIVERDPPLRFVHPLVRAAVYHDLSTGERELRHARAAELLDAAGAPADQVAAHHLLLPPRGDVTVVATLRRAAATALRRGAPENAAVLLERALHEPPPAAERAHLLLDLGRAEAFRSGYRAAGRFEEALTELTDPALRAGAFDALARMLLFTGSHDEGLAVARAAVAELPAELGEERRRLEAVELYATFFGAEAPPDAAGRMERYRTPFADGGLGGLMLNAVAAWGWALAGGSADDCSALALHATATGELAAVDPGVMAVPAVVVLALAGRPEALSLIEALGREAHERSSVFASMGYHLFAGVDLFHRGELDDARGHFEAWRLDGDLWGGNNPGWPLCAAYHARVLLAQSDPVGALQVLESARDRVAAPTFGAMWQCSLAAVHLAQGRPEEALPLLEELDRLLPPRMPPTWLPWRAALALSLERLDRADEALTVAQADLAAAVDWGAPEAVGAALRLLGTLEGPDGIGRLEAAVATLEGSPARYELARALGAHGAALRRSRRPTEAREPLRRALELAEACGATALADEVRSEIYATGARPRSTALSGVGSLTASERRIAAMAAEGRANREIAQALYVTPKTVEVHLSSVYRKLRISSRRDLAHALGA